MTVCRPILTTNSVNTSTVCTVHNELEYSTYALSLHTFSQMLQQTIIHFLKISKIY